MSIVKELFPYPQYENRWHFKYFITFTEECIMNERYFGYWGGRLEVFTDEEQYNIDEFRVLTKSKSFYRLKNFLECRHLNIIGLLLVKYLLKMFYCERVL